MGARGPKPKDWCLNGHDLTLKENVKVVRRGKYTERQCKHCQRDRARQWWRENRSKEARTSAST